MRSFPPLQIIIVVAAFTLLAFPLWRLTWGVRPDPAGQIPEEKTVTDQDVSAASLIIRCAHTPDKLELVSSQGTLGTWQGEAVWPQTISLAYNRKNALELAVIATWPADVSSTAVTLELSPSGLPTQSETRWSAGSEMDDVFTFPRSPQP